jgi:AcrR family transcriptional regulator
MRQSFLQLSTISGMNDTSVKKPNVGGRPRKFDRAIAVETALARFWSQGYDATSTTQLTADIGISQPSLYAAFGSKEGLFREVLDLYLQKHGQFLTNALSSAKSVREGVKQALYAAASLYTDTQHPPGCLVAIGSLQGGIEQSNARLLLSEQRKAAKAVIEIALREAIQRRELSNETDFNTLASYFAMVIQGMAVQAIDGARKDELERIVDLAMSTWPETT